MGTKTHFLLKTKNTEIKTFRPCFFVFNNKIRHFLFARPKKTGKSNKTVIHYLSRPPFRLVPLQNALGLLKNSRETTNTSPHVNFPVRSWIGEGGGATTRCRVFAPAVSGRRRRRRNVAPLTYGIKISFQKPYCTLTLFV